VATALRVFALSAAVFKFISMGKFDRKPGNLDELARRLRPLVSSGVKGECFEQTSVFSRQRRLGRAGQNYLVALACSGVSQAG
jgi:hypothetical protein